MYLTAILCLGENAYGVKIREKVIKLTGKSMVFGTLYNNLDQLVRKGYVVTKKDISHTDTKKIFYSVTNEGKNSLQNSKAIQESLWAAIPKNALT
jgi:DNA-binding PadR family transcriptional regulator